ncbi:MAG: ABC transporter permease [Ectothiorhodospiraceae bacterium]|nr:ABC transporter permease [Ectothiorhodospiraceae bacterium]
MRYRQHSILSFIVRNVPGIGQYLHGRKMYGITVFLAFLFFPMVILLNLDDVVAGFVSFFLSLTLLGLDPSMKSSILRPELVEHWVAALFALTAPMLIWSYERKFYLRTVYAPEKYESTPSDLAWSQFLKQRGAVVGFVVILALYSIAFLCPYIAPYNPTTFQSGVVTQFREPLSSILALRLRDEGDKGVITPTIRDLGEFPKMFRTLEGLNESLISEEEAHLLYIDAYRIEADQVIATIGKESKTVPISRLAGTEPDEFLVEEFHLLGTDSYGRDLLSRIIYGSRVSLSLGFIAVLLSVTLGTIVGLFAGYFGGRADSFTMRFVDVLLAFPSLFLILVIIAVFEQANVPRIMLIVIVLGLSTWMGVARLVRGEVLSLKERDFIFAAKALGLSHWRILTRHILPNSLTPIIVNASLRIGGIILLEAALSYLNLGVQQPTASWGNIIYEGKDFLSNAWWISTLPGFAIVATVVSFNLIGDGLRDALDPMLKNS